MGVWGAGFDPGTIDVAGMKDEMLPGLKEWFTAHIVIYDPDKATETDDPEYDPFGDNIAADPRRIPDECVVWDSGPGGALIQPLRRSVVRAFGGNGEGLSTITIQTSMPPEIVLQSGLRVAVLDGGNATNAEHYVYAIREGFDGSLSWGQIITAEAIT
jgi:hypothetical protein